MLRGDWKCICMKKLFLFAVFKFLNPFLAVWQAGHWLAHVVYRLRHRTLYSPACVVEKNVNCFCKNCAFWSTFPLCIYEPTRYLESGDKFSHYPSPMLCESHYPAQTKTHQPLWPKPVSLYLFLSFACMLFLSLSSFSLQFNLLWNRCLWHNNISMYTRIINQSSKFKLYTLLIMIHSNILSCAQ